MKKDYTVLVPNMLPMHFKMFIKIFESEGIKAELLLSEGQHVKEIGQRYVHNDTCYPAILVIGQFLEALLSGRYDPHKVALIYFQTGGGCRASNYIHLLRKALKRAGFDYVPVISLSFDGLEKHSGLNFNLSLIHRMLYAVLYGDILMSLRNQCRSYELHEGESERLAEKWVDKLAAEMREKKISDRRVIENYKKIIDDFYAIPRQEIKKPRVGIVGEIYVKYSPLGNNNLERFLVSEGTEVVVPGLLDFFMYCVVEMLEDTRLYGKGRLRYPFVRMIYRFLINKQRKLIETIRNDGRFSAPTPFSHTVSLIKGYIGIGAKMGEGWLLTAEMLELSEQGVNNIVCAQPFGCLPNHICGKGMMRPIKEKNPNMNIVAIDYDPGATAVNQENRIKLMIANCK